MVYIGDKQGSLYDHQPHHAVGPIEAIRVDSGLNLVSTAAKRLLTGTNWYIRGCPDANEHPKQPLALNHAWGSNSQRFESAHLSSTTQRRPPKPDQMFGADDSPIYSTPVIDPYTAVSNPLPPVLVILRTGLSPIYPYYRIN